jgi:hypothetical protein
MDLMDSITNYIISKQEGEFPGPLVVQPEIKNSDRINRIDEIFEELADPEQKIGNSEAQLEFLEQLRQQDKQYYTPEFVYKENYPKHNKSLFSDSYGDDDLAVSSDNIQSFDRELQEAGKLLSNPDMFNIFKSGVFSPYFDEIQEPLKLYYKNFNRFPNSFQELIQNKELYET